MLPNRWLVFAVLFATRMTIAYQFQSIASVGPLLTEDLSIGFGAFGALIGCYMLPGVVLALPGGLLDQRFGARRTLVLGLVLMTVGGLLTAGGASVTALFVGRVVSGAGAAILNVVLARAVAAWFGRDSLALVMGTFVASWPLGVALSLISLPAFALSFGWAAALALPTLPCIACALVLGFAYRDPGEMPTGPAGLHFNLTQREFLIASVAGAIWGLYNAAYIIFVAAIPAFLVHRGLSLVDASNVASAFGWVLILSLPLGGFLSQRLEHPNLLMGASFLSIASAALALATSPATMMSLGLLVLTVGVPAGAILAILPNVLPVDRLASGMGVFFTAFYIALAVLPSGAGLARSRPEDVSSPILFGAAIMVVAVALLVGLARLRSRTAAGM